MDEKQIKEQVIRLLTELDHVEMKTNDVPSKVIPALVFRRVSFGLAAMIFSIFILVIGYFFILKSDQWVFIASSVIVLLLGAWQIDKGNRENIKLSTSKK